MKYNVSFEYLAGDSGRCMVAYAPTSLVILMITDGRRPDQ